MANIDEYIKQIQQAQYGEEVRGSIVNALKKVNDDNNSYVAIKKEVVAAKDIVEEKAEIFDEKANAAKETLTALQASTQIANEAKSSLNNIISSAISTKKELEQAVLETGEVIARVDNAKSNLDKSITSAGKAELNLQRQIETSNQIKNQLDVSNNTAIELKKNLDVAINEANTAKVKLVEAINNAGNAALEKIETAQSVATRAVETAKVEAVKAITTAGTTETKKVTDEGAKQVQTVQSIGTQETEKVTAEGTKQVGLVKTEGEKHLASVQTAAQEIIADREQIAKNKTDIADLRQNKADAIIETASGTLLNIKDSAYAKIVNLKINKNVNWVKITGKNLLNVQGEKTGNNINLMEFGTGRIKYTTQDDYGGGYVAYAQVFKAGTYMFSAKITKDGESEKGIRLGFNKEVEIKNNRLIYNSYYKHYFMQEYAKTIEITSNEEFTLMIALNSVTAVKGSVIGISEIQMEQGNTVTNYESYCEEQNVVAPITEDKLNTLHTNYPTTIISNSENAEMQLTYIADTKNYYLGREEILQKQILEIQNALISQKISGGGYNPS